MKHERKKVCTVQKIGYFVFLTILLLVASLPFWADSLSGSLFLGNPFAVLLAYGLVSSMFGSSAIFLLFLGLYFLMIAVMVLLFTLGTFRKQKWMIPFNTILVIDMALSLLTLNFTAVLVDLALIIGANIVVYKLDDIC